MSEKIINDDKHFNRGEITKNEHHFIPADKASRDERAKRLHELIDKHIGNANILVIVGTELTDPETGKHGHSVEIDGLLTAHPTEAPTFLVQVIQGLGKKTEDLLDAAIAVPIPMSSLVDLLTRMEEVKEEESKPEGESDANQAI